MNTDKNRSRTNAGRPQSEKGKDVRAALLKASQQLFASCGYEGISIKAIARQADVNPAMVHYYFGNKKGLFTAVLEETLQPVLNKVKQMSNTCSTDEFIGQFLETYMKTIAANPWLPLLLTREVILPEGSLKDHFLQQIIRPVSQQLKKIIAGRKAEDRLAEIIDPTLATINLVSLAVFPFLALPILGKALEVKLDDDFVERLRQHTTHIYLEGIYNAVPDHD